MKSVTVRFKLNGDPVESTVDARMHLVDFLREQHELSSPRVGCEHGVCGACTLRVDGVTVRGCLLLAAQIDGCAVETIEGLSQSGEIADLQQAFHQRNAMQCGFCTSGMLVAAKELVEQRPDANRAEVREWISGNYCRCTGYHAIVDAICEVLQQRKAAASLMEAPA